MFNLAQLNSLPEMITAQSTPERGKIPRLSATATNNFNPKDYYCWQTSLKPDPVGTAKSGFGNDIFTLPKCSSSQAGWCFIWS